MPDLVSVSGKITDIPAIARKFADDNMMRPTDFEYRLVENAMLIGYTHALADEVENMLATRYHQV